MSEISKNNTNLSSLLVLVIGATGKQGGAVARKLLEKGHHVRALTRNKESYKAKELEKLGAEL
ncbi:MAG: NmrA family NAD(P)-binding protein, partial [Candidatus Heimdallarchaeota archaeon]